MYFQVAVKDPKTGDAVEFPCQRWFSTSEDDGQISRELNRLDIKGDEIIIANGTFNERKQNNLFELMNRQLS